MRNNRAWAARRLDQAKGLIAAASGGRKIRSKRAMDEIGNDGACAKHGQANQPRQEYSRQYDVGQRQADGQPERWRNGVEHPPKKRNVSRWPFALRKRWRALAHDDLSRGEAAGKTDHIPGWATIAGLSAFWFHGELSCQGRSMDAMQKYVSGGEASNRINFAGSGVLRHCICSKPGGPDRSGTGCCRSAILSASGKT
jgi:hypothetical protein